VLTKYVDIFGYFRFLENKLTKDLIAKAFQNQIVKLAPLTYKGLIKPQGFTP